MTLAQLLQNLFLFGAALAVLGFGGGFYIGRRAVPGRTRPAMALWLSLPVLLVAIVVLPGGDPSLSGEAAHRNAPFATVLYSILLGTPFAVASFIGLGLGKAARGPDGK